MNAALSAVYDLSFEPGDLIIMLASVASAYSPKGWIA
jgi:hypothetical protein